MRIMTPAVQDMQLTCRYYFLSHYDREFDVEISVVRLYRMGWNVVFLSSFHHVSLDCPILFDLSLKIYFHFLNLIIYHY